jgi:hypothetical protein
MCDTWEWPPEMAEALAELHRIMIPNPHPDRKILISDLVVNDELDQRTTRR